MTGGMCVGSNGAAQAERASSKRGREGHRGERPARDAARPRARVRAPRRGEGGSPVRPAYSGLRALRTRGIKKPYQAISAKI